MESFYKKGVLYEKFRVHHFQGYKIRNRAEAYLIIYAQEFLNEASPRSIENVKAHLRDIAVNLPKTYGRINFSAIRSCGSIAGHPEYQERQFEITVPGRSIPTLSICETVFKNA